MTYDIDDILYFQARARRLKLSHPPEFLGPPETLQAICNGIGGERSKLTPILTWAFAGYQTSAAIHDVRYHVGGTEADRKAADREFKNNLLVEWKYEWGFFRWFRPLARARRKQLLAAYAAVRLNGHKYFNFKEDEK